MFELITWIILIIVLIISYYYSKQNVKKWFLIAFSLSICLFIIRCLIFIGLMSFNPEYVFSNLGLNNAISLEFYRDFEYYYLNWSKLVKNINFLDIYSQLYNYQYPPFFMVVFFYCNGFEVLPLFVFHLLSGIILWLICLELKIKSKNIVYLYLMNPISIFYSCFNWFNISFVLFWFLYSFYLVLKKEYLYSMFILSISILFKQFVIIFVPFFILYIYFEQNQKFRLFKFIKTHLKYLSIIFCIVGLIYYPFLIWDLDNTLNSLIGGIDINLEYIKHNDKNSMVSFVSMLISLNIDNILTDIIGKLLLSWFFFILLYIYVYIQFFRQIQYDKTLSGFIVNILKICFVYHFLYPRGTFKYYLLFYIPFLLLYYAYYRYNDLENGKFWIWMFIFVIFSRQFYYIFLLYYIFKLSKSYIRTKYYEEK